MSRDATVRIAMWSGPRNISTTMMRSFGSRSDTAVSDEPFYAAYLAATGLDHPMRAAIMAAQPQDWASVAGAMIGPAPLGYAVWYQKHMAHHMVPAFGRSWMDAVTNAFLIRAPEAVLASYLVKRGTATLDDIGLAVQLDLFERVADRTGMAPAVLEAQDVLGQPAAMLEALCRHCGIGFEPAMLAWPAGRRASDGVWAPAWYDKVEASTGFGPRRPDVAFDDLDERLKPIAAAARPLYDRLAAFRLRPAGL